MAAKNETQRARIDEIETALRSTTTCSGTTVTKLGELLFGKSESHIQKENVKINVKATARRRAGTTHAAAIVEISKHASTALSPREKYILATETANIALKSLADALKNPPKPGRSPEAVESNRNAHTMTKPPTSHSRSVSVSQKPLKERSASQVTNSPQKRAIRRSSSYSSFATSGPDSGLVAVAECARLSFAYLSTPEAAKVTGKDVQPLQLETGILALVGKLVALGLDSYAIKEMRTLKRRLEKYLSPGSNKSADWSAAQHTVTETETLASLLVFEDVDPSNHIIPFIIQLQMYALRVIAKSKRPGIIDACWDHVKLSNPASPANLMMRQAEVSKIPEKIARQLESLAQTILSLCPSMSSTLDNDQLQPSPDTVLLLQHLAFKIRGSWWSLAKHQPDLQQEMLQPFTKCLMAYARRSRLSPSKKYKLASSLYTDLAGKQQGTEQNKSTSAAHKTLSSLAQAAGCADEALHWLGMAKEESTSPTSAVKEAARLVRIATVSIEAFLKGDRERDLATVIENALHALKGSLSGSSSDLDEVFLETNKLRRSATRLLIAQGSADDSVCSEFHQLATASIASSIHFTARFVARHPGEIDKKLQERYNERLDMVWKSARSLIDSACASCKAVVNIQETWKELDTLLQECSHILRHLEADFETQSDKTKKCELLSSSDARLSSAYWTTHLLLRKADADPHTFVLAMQRSVDLISSASEADQKSGLLSVKYEHLGDALERIGHIGASRKAYHRCIKSHLTSQNRNLFVKHTARRSLREVFSSNGSFSGVVRALQSFHRSFIKSGIQSPSEVAFYDDMELEPAIRGALLEYQLSLYLRALARNRQWHESLYDSVSLITQRLQEVYTPVRFPLRYLRVLTAMLQLSQSCPSVMDQFQPSLDELKQDHGQLKGSDDEWLAQSELHIISLFRLKVYMRQEIPSPSDIRQCLNIWEDIINQSKSSSDLEKRVEDTDILMQELEGLTECLNVKGLEYLALPALQLLVRLHALRESLDTDRHVAAICQLGLQWLRLGYTEKAGLSFTEAETIMKSLKCSVETKLKWSIACSEYLLTIGNTNKCASILSAAQAMVSTDDEFMGLSTSSATLSKRIRFNRILADAAYVYSLFDFVIGSYKSAMRNARQCINLNRRIWAGIESRSKEKQVVLMGEADMSMDETHKSAFDPLSSVRNEKGAPLVMSVTHEVLGGADFWSLVPAMYRALMQHSRILAHQGQLHEAMYVAEQAEKVAAASKSPTFMTDNASWRADCWTRSGRSDKAAPILDVIKEHSKRQCLSTVSYHSAIARVHHHAGIYQDEIASYDSIEELINHLRSPAFIQSLTVCVADVDSLTEQLGKVSLTEPEPGKAELSTGLRGRKAKGETVKRIPVKKNVRSRAAPASSRSAAQEKTLSKPYEEVQTTLKHQYCTLRRLWDGILDRKVIARVLQQDLKGASMLLNQIERSQGSGEAQCFHAYTAFRTLFAQSIDQIMQDITVNSLPESTIAFPAINMTESPAGEDLATKSIILPKPKSAKAKISKKTMPAAYIETLQKARKRLVEAQTQTSANDSSHLLQQISVALGQVTVLLSAVVQESCGSLHPLFAASMNETAKCNALRLMQGLVGVENEQMSREECLRWPSQETSLLELPSTVNFQREYIDIIPSNWNVVSVALNEARNELYITRFESGSIPFLLRLPLVRDASRDMNDEEFSFDDGKRDFDEIIELNDFSTRTAKDMTSKDARQQWWDERAALDARLYGLLQNIENIWLGGFKGVFSQHEKQPKLLACFRNALETIMNNHLPSRQKKMQQQKLILDPRVLELFIGLGDATDLSLDLDDSLMDLLYFVVDILHFSGERNAYDEIDFDKMVVETHDALQAYHSAARKPLGSSPHLILILDNNLHAFPWESLPCLENSSVSRLPSLAALRERLLAARQSINTPDQAGHYITVANGGTSVLNPSGDLKHTLKTLQPRLSELQGSWWHIANRAPTETEFEDSLHDKELVLYFGHGSGAQYVRSKAVRRLYTRGSSTKQDGTNQPNCATTLLFGCSSVHLIENGIYEPSGMLASYLVAGAPAVAGMLWDVTDKDCDRFAVRVGELWGLWPEQQDDSTMRPAKTPSRGGKVKAKAGLGAEEVENATSIGVRGTKKGRKPKAKVGKMSAESQRRTSCGLDEAVREARSACVLRYLNGAAAVVYGIPVYLQ